MKKDKSKLFFKKTTEKTKLLFKAIIEKVVRYRKPLVLTVDIAIIPAIFFLKWLAGFMLSTDRPCSWTLMGLQCATCGGTRCVNFLLQGNLVDAFLMNPFIFCCIVYAVASLILLNIAVFTDAGFAKKALRVMFSWYSLAFGAGSYGIFFLVRNIINVVKLLQR